MSIKRCSKCEKFKPNTLQFYHKDATKRDGLNTRCKACKVAYMKQYNKDSTVERAAYRKDNAAAKAAYSRQYHKDNATANKAARAAYTKQHRADNPSLYAASNAKRRAAKLLRTVSWSNYHAIAMWYKRCPEGYHVDHIVPLQGKTVSGLHVHNNLQYLTQGLNASKGNKYNDWSEYTRTGRRKRK